MWNDLKLLAFNSRRELLAVGVPAVCAIRTEDAQAVVETWTAVVTVFVKDRRRHNLSQ
jgi:hypothetical protein